MIQRVDDAQGCGVGLRRGSRHVDHREDPFQVAQVGGVAGGQGEPVAYGGGGDQEIHPAGSRVSPAWRTTLASRP